jgi:hypothetical protein
VTRRPLRQFDDDLYSADNLFWLSLMDHVSARCADAGVLRGPMQNLWEELLGLRVYFEPAMAGGACEVVFIAVVVVPSDEPEHYPERRLNFRGSKNRKRRSFSTEILAHL